VYLPFLSIGFLSTPDLREGVLFSETHRICFLILQHDGFILPIPIPPDLKSRLCLCSSARICCDWTSGICLAHVRTVPQFHFPPCERLMPFPGGSPSSVPRPYSGCFFVSDPSLFSSSHLFFVLISVLLFEAPTPRLPQ